MNKSKLSIVVWMFVFYLSGVVDTSALTNLLRAYFEDLPAGSAPKALVGTIEAVAGSEVRVGEGQFPGGSMRITHDGDGFRSQRWTFSQFPPTGDGSLSWEMTVNTYPSGNYINLFSCFQEDDTPFTYQCFSINFGPDGAIVLNGRTLSVTYATNVRHRYRIGHDMTTGRYVFYVDGVFADQGYFGVHQRMRWHHASLRMPDGYTGTLWMDNIRAVSTRPWVAQVWSDFESYPPSSSLSRGAVPGYPEGDFLDDIVYAPGVDNLDMVVAPPGFAFGQSLRMRNGDTSGINFEIDPYADPPPEGRYRASYRYRQTGGAGQNKLLIVGSAFDFTLMNNLFEDSVLYANSNFTKTAVASLQNQRTYHVEIEMDTIADLYKMDLDGFEVVPGWPVFDTGRPHKLKFGTGSAPTDTAYLDDISLERRSRQGLYAMYYKTSPTEFVQNVRVFREGLPEPDAWLQYTNRFVFWDGAFGRDGMLYLADYQNGAVRKWNAATMQELDVCTDPRLENIVSVASLKDGHLLALSRDILSVGHLVRVTTQPFAVDQLLPTGRLSVNVRQVRMSPNGKRVYISFSGFPYVMYVYRYPDMVRMDDLATSLALSGTVEFDVAPSGLLYLLDETNQRIVVLDPDTDQTVAILGGLDTLGFAQDLCVLSNGDLAVGGQAGIGVLDGVSGELLDVFPHNEPFPATVLTRGLFAGPEMSITGLEKTADRTYRINYQTEPTRWLDLEISSSLTTGSWAKVGQLYGTNFTMQVIHTHDPSRAEKGVYRIKESGL